MTRTQLAMEAIKEFAEHVSKQGFTFYIGKSGTYGVLTHPSTDRIMSVTYDCDSFDGLCFSGNYRPSISSGGGWRIAKDQPTKTFTENLLTMLKSSAPRWANDNPVYTTIEQHLKFYKNQFEKYVPDNVRNIPEHPVGTFNDCK